jgi:hypothetical protein
MKRPGPSIFDCYDVICVILWTVIALAIAIALLIAVDALGH